MRRRLVQEGPLVEIINTFELGQWLRKQPREVSVAFAARAALRVLPDAQDTQIGAFRDDFYAAIVLPVFRAMVVSWAAAKYPAHKPKITVAAYAENGARFAAYAAGNDAAHAGAVAARDTAFAAYYALHMDATGAEHAATYAASAFAYADAASAADALTMFWSAVSFDATGVEEGAAASDIARSPLWPEGQPDWLQSLWQKMKAWLHAAKQDWEVWTNWYDDRLEGHVRDEKRELAYVRIEEALWNQGPAIVNAEIKRRIEEA